MKIHIVIHAMYRHTSEILQVRFQITAIKQVTRIFLVSQGTQKLWQLWPYIMYFFNNET
jgi:hypothetical protein